MLAEPKPGPPWPRSGLSTGSPLSSTPPPVETASSHVSPDCSSSTLRMLVPAFCGGEPEECRGARKAWPPRTVFSLLVLPAFLVGVWRRGQVDGAEWGTGTGACLHLHRALERAAQPGERIKTPTKGGLLAQQPYLSATTGRR